MDVKQVVQSKGFAVAVSSVVSAAASAALTHQLVKVKLKNHYEEIASQEIEDTKAFYAEKQTDVVDVENEEESVDKDHEDYVEVVNRTNYNSVSTDVADLIQAAVDGGVTVEITPSEEPEPPAVKNVFAKEEWDYEAEVLNRRNNEPFIIHHDEFMENQLDHEQESLRYFEGDDVLISSNEDIVGDIESVVGEANLTRFGHGSKDNNMLYVRNERLEVDFEIIRDMNSYSEVVAGFSEEDSLEHSSHQRNRRRFRHEDE